MLIGEVVDGNHGCLAKKMALITPYASLIV